MQTVGGIPILLRYSTAEAQCAENPDVMRAIDLAKAAGWRQALEQVFDPGMVAYSSSQDRWTFLDAVPLRPDAVALEIGIGFGQHTGAIASRVAHLDALEVNLPNALFAKTRCEQDGAANVAFTCGGDDCRLPFADNAYDAVLLNLVLEWCASRITDEPAPVAQARLLSEIHRVLKPGGVVQINTKNRFAYRLLTGGADEHLFGLPFGSALPRWLSGLILRLKSKPRPPGHLYSWWGLKRLLERVGFGRIESYWAVPDMRFPERLVATDAASIRDARRHLARQGDTRRTALLMALTPAGLVKAVAPGLFFVARKQ